MLRTASVKTFTSMADDRASDQNRDVAKYGPLFLSKPHVIPSPRAPMPTLIERECSMKEVARTLNLSLAAVKSRLYRARKQLTCSATFNGRVPNVDSILGSKRQFEITGLQNREVACPSCD